MKKTALIALFFAALSAVFTVPSFADEATLSRQMSEVIQNQKKILDSLEQVKSELQVVKVRITSH